MYICRVVVCFVARDGCIHDEYTIVHDQWTIKVGTQEKTLQARSIATKKSSNHTIMTNSMFSTLIIRVASIDELKY